MNQEEHISKARELLERAMLPGRTGSSVEPSIPDSRREGKDTGSR